MRRRFCAKNAKLTTAFSRRGLIAEHGTSWILPRLVGPARPLDLLISARVFRGSEAAELGLVNRAVEDELVLDVALEYARDVAANVSPGECGNDQAAGVRGADQTARRCTGARQCVDARIVLEARFRGGCPELCRKAAADLPATRGHCEHVNAATHRQ
ncbi:MAG: enoyl-CoA hydratase-related protein [Solirubrobacteraceae bacterium]